MDFGSKVLLAIIFLFLLRQLKRFVQWFVLFSYWRRTIRDFPGPPSLYFIGCLRELRGGLAALPDFLLTQSAKVIESGENVMRIWLGPILRIYVLDSDAVKVLTNSPVELEKGWDYDRLHDWIGDGLLTSTDEKWRQSRKRLVPAFHFAKLDDYALIMDQHARELIEHLKPMADGKEHNIYSSIKHAALDIIAETAMGIELNALGNPEQEYTKAAATYIYQSFWRGVSPLYVNDFAWWISGNQQKQKRALMTLKAKSMSVVRERVHILSKGLEEIKKKPDFLGLLLEAHKERKLTFQQVQGEVDTFLFGGYDTTSHAITWTLWCLATHPEWQERVYKEIKEQFGNSDAEFQTNKVKDLKYLNACIKESMRILPPVPLIERRLRNEVQVGKWTLPKRATVVIPIFAIHHNPKVFPRHWEFEPENFMGDKEYPSNAYIPFSAGVRNCIGQKFSMREIRIVLIHLLFNFRFSTPRKFRDNKPSIELVLVPTLGLPLHFEQRSC